MNERQAEVDSNFDRRDIIKEKDDEHIETSEMPDMQQVLARFGISRDDTAEGNSDIEDSVVEGEAEESDVTDSQGGKILRRSERIKKKT